MNPILVEVMRGPALESAHRGALAVLDADGAVLAAIGDVSARSFRARRSRCCRRWRWSRAAPPTGSASATTSSRSPAHRTAASRCTRRRRPACSRRPVSTRTRSSAASTGRTTRIRRARSRQTGARRPRCNNNCSGKHAGFLCLACALHSGPDLRRYVRGYVAPDHPVMREVTAALQATTGFDLGDDAARHRRLLDPDLRDPAAPPRARVRARRHRHRACAPGHAAAARRLRAAVARDRRSWSPAPAASTPRVMERLGERVFCKVGAEGVFCAALPERGLGVAIKIDDGNNARAAEVVMAAAIEAFVALDDEEAAFMRALQRDDPAQLERHRGRCAARDSVAARCAGTARGRLTGSRRFRPRGAAAPRASAACRPRAAACRRGSAASAGSARRCRSCGACCG